VHLAVVEMGSIEFFLLSLALHCDLPNHNFRLEAQFALTS
jgi:hypothetical protein